MYGDDYQPEKPNKYAAVCKFFSACESREDLGKALMLYLFDKSYPRPDLHVAHKRTCLQKGWE